MRRAFPFASREGRSCAPVAAEFSKQLIAHLSLWPARLRIVAVLSQSVTKHLPVPIRHPDFLWRGGNAVPERLNVLHLLLHWHLVEPGWWDAPAPEYRYPKAQRTS
jgi:hypothetical protein